MTLELTKEEQEAADAILNVMEKIRALYGDENPHNFVNEAIPAIHTLQMFVQQHWAHRVLPEYWSDWTDRTGKST
jgi:hypothetical protein